MFNLFKRKHKDESLEEAISFMKKQMKNNKDYMEKVKDMGFSIEHLKEWDRLYLFIIDQLKSMRK